jgi:predicted adenine nucleotide alpha hydrolase (AANH) superfamily ATPase
VNKWLNENDFEVKGYFYNPNISPNQEYERRLLTMEHYATEAGLKVVCPPNRLPTEPGDCENCYRVRLEKTASFAKAEGFDCFSTTLLISPYQKHDLLKQVGEELGKEHGIEFFYQDFRIGYRESREMAREMKLYQQKYCGCGIDLKPPKEGAYAKVNGSA